MLAPSQEEGLERVGLALYIKESTTRGMLGVAFAASRAR